MLFRLPVLKRNQSAWCPRCNAKVRDGRDWSLTRLGSMALAMLLLMPFAWSEPLLRLHLLGVRIDANVLQGIWQMTAQGDPITAAMVLFCAVVAPVLLVVSISYLWLGNVLGMNLRPVLLMLGKLKEWVMLDIYLVGIGVASIKVAGLRLPAAGHRSGGVYLPDVVEHPDAYSYERRRAMGAFLSRASGDPRR
ncbi:PqiA family integral membrane protein [Klebsiella aerogenes]|nr:PqiA family integral membrane protein [Klebsiella aerogenes]